MCLLATELFFVECALYILSYMVVECVVVGGGWGVGVEVVGNGRYPAFSTILPETYLCNTLAINVW